MRLERVPRIGSGERQMERVPRIGVEGVPRIGRENGRENGETQEQQWRELIAWGREVKNGKVGERVPRIEVETDPG